MQLITKILRVEQGYARVHDLEEDFHEVKGKSAGKKINKCITAEKNQDKGNRK
jgi:uncharacterized protein (UPF0335 family)